MNWECRMTADTFAEKIAVELLARDGSAAVWRLHLVAASAHHDGCLRAAESLLEIADAAERLTVRSSADQRP